MGELLTQTNEYTRSHPDNLIVVTVTLNSDGVVLDIYSLSTHTRGRLVERGANGKFDSACVDQHGLAENSALRGEWHRRAARAWRWRISLDGAFGAAVAPGPKLHAHLCFVVVAGFRSEPIGVPHPARRSPCSLPTSHFPKFWRRVHHVYTCAYARYRSTKNIPSHRVCWRLLKSLTSCSCCIT